MSRSAPPRAVVLAPLLVIATAMAGCGEEAASAPGRVGSSIAILGAAGDHGAAGERAAAEVVVVNPDHGSVSFLDARSLESLATVDVGDEPRALLVLGSGALLVTTHRGGEIVRLDPASRKVLDRKPICAGPWGLAEAPDGGAVVVACEHEGTVVRLDVDTLASEVIVAGLSRPRAVAFEGGSVIAAGFTGGRLHTVSEDGAVTTTSLVPALAPYRPALAAMSANLTTALHPAFGRVHVAHQLVNHDGSSGIEDVADDYGTVLDGNPKINPAVTSLLPGAAASAGEGDPPVLYARFDGGPRVFNGPQALASFGDRYLLVAHVSTADVAVIDTLAADVTTRAVASFAVGAGPSGIAVDAVANVAFVDNALDGSVSRLDLTAPVGPEAPRHPAALTLVRSLPSKYSLAALAGRRLFHDASNPHVTPSGVVACSTCHPDGGDDGLVWFIHTTAIPTKRRRTPHLAGAHTDAAPYHWDGAFPTMEALGTATITDLMAGDALLVDVASLRAFVDEMVLPPRAPQGDAGAVERGRALFESPDTRCAVCHAGPDLTDNALHAVLTPMSLSEDDVITQVNTPALRGVFARAPYFHDGRSPDLHDLLTRKDATKHGDTSGLDAAALDDLVAYLKSL